MVRTVKSLPRRNLKKEERALLLPAANVAQPWETWVLAPWKNAEMVQTCLHPKENYLSKKCTFGLPARSLLCLPLWLNETDSKLFPNLISLQLELRGLLGRNRNNPVFQWTLVTQEEKRSLLLVGLLPSSLPEDLQATDYETFDLSTRYWSFPENSLTLWLEQGRLCVAVTRDAHLVYFQGLTDAKITQRVLQDLVCLRSSLEFEHIITQLRGITLWAAASAEEIASLKKALNMPVRSGERPLPRRPATTWALIPPIVNMEKKKRETSKLQRRVLLGTLVVYLGIAGNLLTHFFMTQERIEELEQWHAAHAQTLGLIHSTQAAWKELQPVTNPQSYPLEKLLHCSEAITSDDMHLTLFETHDNNSLLIKGEAKNVAAAFQFADALKKNSFFTGYNWNVAQPHLLPNDLAQLQIEGTP